MADEDLARETAELLNCRSGSQSRTLNQLATLLTRQVPGCSGATTALWSDGEPVVRAATHPDLAYLFDKCLQSGPWQEAIASGTAVSCPDTLDEPRWPGFASLALSRGVRCSVTAVHRSGRESITGTMFGARPRSLGPGQLSLAGLLVGFGGSVMGNASQHGDMQRTVLQLHDAARSRSVSDQAKGILMHLLNCTADEALAQMRALSQTSHLKVSEVAGRIIESQGGGEVR
ncbi:MAG TPA: ANTAR domain-containing protein [Streptosporangiaceae bacterium]|nr:ANTAR domain-containing protein [Streptosporangiaceae bacterium]